jgi:hypothetical protein
MSRLVSVRYVGAVAASKGDDDNTAARIAKYIPGEIIAFFSMWTQGVAILPWKNALLTCEVVGIIVGLIVTPLYFSKFFPNAPPEARAAHRWISTIAFAVYAYTISAAVIPEYFVAGLALLATALITLVSALFIPTKS